MYALYLTRRPHAWRRDTAPPGLSAAEGRGRVGGRPKRVSSQAEIPGEQREPRDLAHWLRVCANCEEALRRAHVESSISMTALAGKPGVSVARVSQLIARAEVPGLAGTAPRAS